MMKDKLIVRFIQEKKKQKRKKKKRIIQIHHNYKKCKITKAYRVCSSLQSDMITPFTTPIFIQMTAEARSKYSLERMIESTKKSRKILGHLLQIVTISHGNISLVYLRIRLKLIIQICNT